jgi:hypothetical protein
MLVLICLKICWPKIISNKDLWRVTGQEDINLEIRKRKFRWIGHTLRKEDGEIPKAAPLWNPQGSRKRGRPKTSWRRSVIKEGGRSWNELRFWQLIDRSGKNSWATYVPKGKIDSIIVIIIIIIIIIITITCMQGIYTYIPETNHVSRVYSVAAVLYLHSVLHVMLFHP